MFKLHKIYTLVPINRYRNRHMRCSYAIWAYTLRNNSQCSQRAPQKDVLVFTEEGAGNAEKRFILRKSLLVPKRCSIYKIIWPDRKSGQKLCPDWGGG